MDRDYGLRHGRCPPRADFFHGPGWVRYWPASEFGALGETWREPVILLGETRREPVFLLGETRREPVLLLGKTGREAFALLLVWRRRALN